MHKSVIEWVNQKVVHHRLNNPGSLVLEVGSLDVNGSVRPFFSEVERYIGVDMREGAGVDMIANAHDLSIFGDRSFDVVVSTEMLEHDDEFWLSMQEMGRVLKHGGYLIITARGNGMPEHSFPYDFYRFMPNSMPKLMALAGCELVCGDDDHELPGVLILGRKP